MIINNNSKEYWQNKLNKNICKTVIPSDKNNIGIEMKEFSFDIDSEVINEIFQLSNFNETKTYVILTTAILITINKITSEDLLMIGIPMISNKTKSITNPFLIIHSEIKHNQSFTELLKNISDEIFISMRHGHFPIENILYDTKNNDDISLFDISVTLENLQNQSFLNNYKHNIKFLFNIQNGIIQGKIQYNSFMYEDSTVKYIINLLKNVLKNSLQDQNVPLSKISGINDDEKIQILENFNNKINIIDKQVSIISLFKNKVKSNPLNAAVLCKEIELTYEELDRESTLLSQHLIKRYNVIVNDKIGIIMQRKSTLMVVILGILKTGASFIPIDPTTPRNRIEDILAISNIKFLINEYSAELSIPDRIELIDMNNIPDGSVDESLLPVISAENIAYVLYTSGTTGIPKGVLVSHYSVVNRMYWMQTKFKLNHDDTILQKTSISFDVSICELFRWINGESRLCFVDDETKKDIRSLINYIELNKITTIDFTPKELDVFLDLVKSTKSMHKLKTLRWVFVGAETIAYETVMKFNKLLSANYTELINEYGPTEATVDVTYFNCTRNKINNIVPIGKPIQNNQVYIIDKHSNLLPVGIIGELCISGHNLALGYLNDQQTTLQKFVPNPFVTGQRMYKTGDLARWLDDGNIEFKGRNDKQIKINGHRIELRDIESKILQLGNIENVHIEAIDITKENSNKLLCAYLITKNNAYVDKSDIILMLRTHFPEYLIPKFFYILNEFPLKDNGKLDIKALPIPNSISNDIITPQNAIEIELLSIWSEILKIAKDKISILDNFFEFGGNSLNVNLMSSKIEYRFNKKISLLQIFEFPTIKELSLLILNQHEIKRHNHIQVLSQESYILSTGQQRLFFLQELEPDSTAYNLPFIIQFKVKPNLEQIETILNKLLLRHESLRTFFLYQDGYVKQKINDNVKLKLNYIDFSSPKKNVFNEIQKLVKPFILDESPLLRAFVIKTPESKYLFFIDMHHIIADAFSHSYLINDFMSIYCEKKLSSLSRRFVDYVFEEYEMLKSNEMLKQKKFWLKKFESPYEHLNLPTDFKRPEIRSSKGNCIKFTFNHEQTMQINNFLKKHNCTLSTYFLTIYFILLQEITNQDDIIIGIPVDTRNQEIFNGVVGNFTNMIALREKVIDNISFIEFLQIIKKNLINCIDNAMYPFEELVKDLNIKMTSSRNALIDVALNIVEFEIKDEYKKYFESSPIKFEHQTSKYDIFLRIFQIDHELILSLEYSVDLFEKATIKKCINSIKEIISKVLKDETVLIKSMSQKTQSLSKAYKSNIDFNLL